jgi:hypothetical protein
MFHRVLLPSALQADVSSPDFRQEPLILRLTEPGCPMARRLATRAFPALQSDSMAFSGASSRKQIPSNQIGECFRHRCGIASERDLGQV